MNEMKKVTAKAEEVLSNALVKDENIYSMRETISVNSPFLWLGVRKRAYFQEHTSRNEAVHETYKTLLKKVAAKVFPEGKGKRLFLFSSTELTTTGQEMYVKARAENIKLLKEKITLEAQLNSRRQ